MQVPCFVCRGVCKYSTFWTHRRCACVLSFGHWCWCFVAMSRVCAWGFSGMTHHVSRCPLHPTLPCFCLPPHFFPFSSPYFTPWLCFLSFILPPPIWKEHLNSQLLSLSLCITHNSWPAGKNARLSAHEYTAEWMRDIEEGGGGAYVHTWTELALYEDAECRDLHVSFFALQCQ